MKKRQIIPFLFIGILISCGSNEVRSPEVKDIEKEQIDLTVPQGADCKVAVPSRFKSLSEPGLDLTQKKHPTKDSLSKTRTNGP